MISDTGIDNKGYRIPKSLLCLQKYDFVCKTTPENKNPFRSLEGTVVDE